MGALLLGLDRNLADKPGLRDCLVEKVGLSQFLVDGNELRAVDPLAPGDAEQVSRAKGRAVAHLDFFDALFSQSEYIAGLRDDGSTDELDPLIDEDELRPSWDGWTGWSNDIVNTLQVSEVICVVLHAHAQKYKSAWVEQPSTHCPIEGSAD